MQGTAEGKDSVETKKNQRDLDITMNQALRFRKAHAELQNVEGSKFEVEKAARLLSESSMNNQINATSSGNGDVCTSCSAFLEKDLNFCPACGTTKK